MNAVASVDEGVKIAEVCFKDGKWWWGRVMSSGEWFEQSLTREGADQAFDLRVQTLSDAEKQFFVQEPKDGDEQHRRTCFVRE